jgi:hypothetical protein
MMKSKLIGLVTSLMLFGAMPSQAVPLVDLGNITYDPNTGLRWLDVNLSANRSYTYVSSQFGVGGEFAGYRYASGNEVNTLFLDAGIKTVPCNHCSGDDQFALYDSLISMLGVTYNAVDIRDTAGLISDTPNPGSSNRGIGLVQWDTRSGPIFFYASAPYFYVGGGGGVGYIPAVPEESYDPSFGSFLVATPLPSTWLMLLSGFVGLGYFAYRGSKKAVAIAA